MASRPTSGTGTTTNPDTPCQVPQVQGGPIAWSVHQNKDWSREYRVTYLVRTNPTLHGPFAALYAAGLPQADTVWTEGSGGTIDIWAWFTGEREVRQAPGPPTTDNQFWHVECLATTKPTQDCVAAGLDSPFSIPDRVRVETVTYSKEGIVDRFGDPLINSAWEQFRGPQVEYDNSKIRVYIEQNVNTLDLTFVNSIMHNLNDTPLWGFTARHVKLSHCEFEPRYYLNCRQYWIRKLMFDIANDFDPFDRCILDEGTRVLRGQWDKNPASATYGQYILGTTFNGLLVVPVDPQRPRDFIRYQDWNGNPTRLILNGNGAPYLPNTVITGAITNATNTTPIVITSSNHGLTYGDTITITGVTGNTAANGTWVITIIDVDTFLLIGSVGNGAYTGGGIWSFTSTIGKFCYEYYDETNLLALGIPTSLEQ